MLFEGFTNIFIRHKKNESKPQLVKNNDFARYQS